MISEPVLVVFVHSPVDATTCARHQAAMRHAVKSYFLLVFSSVTTLRICPEHQPIRVQCDFKHTLRTDSQQTPVSSDGFIAAANS